MKKQLFTTLRKVFLAVLTFWSCQLLYAQTWSPIKGVQAQDISIGSEGEVWITGKDNSIMRWNGSAFEKMKGSARRISVGADGIPWIVNNAGKIGYYDSENDKWVPVVGSAKDIGVGADGSVWIVGTKPVEGGFEVLKWNSDEETWEEMEFGAVRIAVDGSGNPWMVNDEHKIFAYIEEEQQEYDGEMLDVGIGADGSVWAITTEKGIVKLEDDRWVEVNGNAIGITATSNGSPWIVNANGVVAKLGKLVGDEKSDSDKDVTDANEEKKELKDVKSNQASSLKTDGKDADEGNPKEKVKEETENVKEEEKSKEKVDLTKMSGTPVEFYNTGNKPVEVYKSSSNQLGELVTEIRPRSRVKIPVNIGDEFEVGINKEIGRHPKVYITNTKENVILFGNGPIKEMQFIAEKFSILDYQSNQAGVDLTRYNPRDLVNTINKGRIFEILDVAEGIDYRIVGDGKIMKHGFEYASANHHEGSNQVTMSYGYNSFSKNWSLNVGGSGSIPLPQSPGTSVNPALDFGYSESEMEDKTSESTYAYSREQKSIFTITVDPQKAQLDQEFKDAVRNVTDKESAKDFVEQYGTHYPKVVFYGGDRSVYAVFNKEQYSKAKSFGIDLKAKVGVSKMKAKSKETEGFNEGKTTHEKSEVGEGHLGFEYKQGSEEESVFENTISKYRMIGGSGGFENWEVDEKNAAPIASELELIYTLIDPQVFKDGTDPAILTKAKTLIQAAVIAKLKSMPMLKAPLSPPNVYSVTIEKMEVIEEVDDANKNTKGDISVEITYKNNGSVVSRNSSGNFWSKPDYSLDFKFVKGTVIFPNATYKHVDFPDSSTGKFNTLMFNVKGIITEKDDLLGDDKDEMSGETNEFNIRDLNLAPGQSTPSRTFDVSYSVPFHQNKIKITYKIRREPSEFDDKLLKW